jgi:hypothetical protein
MISTQNPLPFWQHPPPGTRLTAGSGFPVKFLEMNCPKSEQNPAGNVQPRMHTDEHGLISCLVGLHCRAAMTDCAEGAAEISLGLERSDYPR